MMKAYGEYNGEQATERVIFDHEAYSRKACFFTYKGERFSILPERERIRIGLIDTNLKKLSREETQTAIDGEKSIEYVIDTSF